MKHPIQRLAAAAALVLASAASHATTLLDNAGFESGLASWTATGVSADAGDVHSGSLAALLTDDASALTASLTQATAVSAIGSFGFWGRSDAGVLSLVVLTYSDGSDSGTDVSIFDLGNTGWTYYDLTGYLAAGKSLTGLTIYGSSAAATLVDDVVLTSSVTAVPEPASALLMLAGSVVLMRRRLRP